MAVIDLKRLDLNLLVVFDTVYATRNITRAADQLALTQPAVSNALTRLRDLLHDPLFVRARHGVEPTIKATQIAGAVSEALDILRAQFTPGEIDLSTYRRHFRVLIADIFEPIVLAPLAQAIAARAPHITVEIVPVIGSDLVRDLREGRLDLACHIFPPFSQDIVSEAMGGSDLVLASRKGHPGIGRKLDLATLQRLPFIVLVPEVRNLIAATVNLAAQGIRRREVFMVSRIGAMPAIVARTDLVALLPRWYVRAISKNFDLVPHDLPVQLPDQISSMSWHAKNTSDAGLKWLRETLMSAFHAHMRKRRKS